MVRRLLLAFLAAVLPLALAKTNACTGGSSCGASGPYTHSVGTNSLVQRKYHIANLTVQEVSNTGDTRYPRRFTSEDVDNATQLAETPTGMLVFHATKAMVNLCEYRGYVAGPPEVHPNNVSLDEVVRNISTIITPWCNELTKFTGRPCDAWEPLAGLITQTRCVLEISMAKTGFPPAPIFAFAIEMMDIAREDCIMEFEPALEAGEPIPAKCPGEWGTVPAEAIQHAEDLGYRSLAQLSSESQAAVAVTQEIWRAAGRVEHLAKRLHDEVAPTLQMEAIKSMWQSTCATLGCDVSSHKDITDALYGHTAKLIELKASGVALYHHIQAMGHARRAYVKIINSKPFQEGLRAKETESLNHSLSDSMGFLAFSSVSSGKGGAGTKSYEATLSQSTRILSAIEAMIHVSHDLGVPLFAGSQMAAAADTEGEIDGSEVGADQIVTVEGRPKNGRRRSPRRRRSPPRRRSSPPRRRREHPRAARRRSSPRRRRTGCGNVFDCISDGVKMVVEVAEDTFACASLSAGDTIGYERTFSPYTSIGLFVTVEDASNFVNWFKGEGFSICKALKISATATVAGPAPKSPTKAQASCAAGMSFNVEAHLDTCGAMEAGISVSFSAGCTVTSFECVTIPVLSGVANCVRTYFAGLTVACAKFNLKTGQYIGRTPW